MSATHTHRNPARDIVDTATRRRIAVLVGADERTVDKVLRGERVRGDVGVRIQAFLIDCGIAEPKQQPSDHPSDQLSAEDAAAKAWAESNPNDPRAAEILQRLKGRGP